MEQLTLWFVVLDIYSRRGDNLGWFMPSKYELSYHLTKEDAISAIQSHFKEQKKQLLSKTKADNEFKQSLKKLRFNRRKLDSQGKLNVGLLFADIDVVDDAYIGIEEHRFIQEFPRQLLG